MTEVSAVEVVTSNPNKPSNGETLISLVLDETGSMMSCYDSTISSVNDYIGSQQSAPGIAKASLYTFSAGGGYGYSRGGGMSLAMQANTGSNKNARPVFENKPIGDVEFLTRENYKPNGGTNLYDAIGITIRNIESQLADQASVPNVLIVIVTDGGENASTEFNLDGIKALVKQKENEGWTFIYLGANQDAWQVGSSFGLSKGQTMSYSTADMAGTMATLNSATTAYRGLRSSGAVGAGVVAKNFFAPGDEESK